MPAHCPPCVADFTSLVAARAQKIETLAALLIAIAEDDRCIEAMLDGVHSDDLVRQ